MYSMRLSRGHTTDVYSNWRSVWTESSSIIPFIRGKHARVNLIICSHFAEFQARAKLNACFKMFHVYVCASV